MLMAKALRCMLMVEALGMLMAQALGMRLAASHPLGSFLAATTSSNGSSNCTPRGSTSRAATAGQMAERVTSPAGGA